MSTLHTMTIALADIEGRLVRELQFSTDAEKHILDDLAIVKTGLEELERSVRAAFSERSRALSAAIGSGKPSPETVDAEPARKPKLVKASAPEGDAA